MKPDAVATAALEPMETLESNPNEIPEALTDQEPGPSKDLLERDTQQPVEEMGHGEPLPKRSAGKALKSSGESKAKAATKTTARTKPGLANSTKTTSSPRTSAPQSRVANGVPKPQTNGAAKKPTLAGDKKSTPTLAPPKKPSGAVGASKPPPKPADRKVPTSAPGPKTTAVVPPVKKAASTPANGVKSSAGAAAAKKPPAPKSANGTTNRPSTGTASKSDKPPIPKTTRTASSRPTTASSATTPKSSTTTPKSATAKPPSTKLTTPKSATSTPSGGKAPASQTTRTPVKKDATKPATPAAKKPGDSPLTRPGSANKTTKPETPKSSTKLDISKKPLATKAADMKTPSRPKTQEGKPTTSKEVSKINGAKSTAPKTASPKKIVGSSTPTPVKRGPKAVEVDEPAKKEVAAAVAAAAAIATAAAAIAGSEEPQPPADACAEPSAKAIENIPEAAPEAELQDMCKTEAEPVREVAPEVLKEAISEPKRVPTPEPLREPTPEPVRLTAPELQREPTPEPVRLATPEPERAPTPEPVRLATPEPEREPTPEPERIPTPEPVRLPTPEPERIPTPEPVRLPTPEPTRPLEKAAEPVQEQTPVPERESTPEITRSFSPDYTQESVPKPLYEPASQNLHEPTQERTQDFGAGTQNSEYEEEEEPDPLVEESRPPADASLICGAAQMDYFGFKETSHSSLPPSLGTTVLSPPHSPLGQGSPVREPESVPYLSGVGSQSYAWDLNQPGEMLQDKNMEEHEEEDKENLFAASTTGLEFNAPSDPHDLGAPLEDCTSKTLIFSPEKEEAVEKADQEINEDVDDDDDDEEEVEDEEEEDEEEQRRLGHQFSSMITDASSSQPSEELQLRSSGFGGSTAWHGDDLLSGMDSEDVSSCTSSRLQGVSDLSSTLHTAILEGTQSSDALVDSSLRGSEGDCNLMGSPNVETLANEEEEEDDEEDERVDDMDMSSEQTEEHHKLFREQNEEEDEDVEMHSEGQMESCGNVDEDGFNEEEHHDNINHPGPPISAWSQSNPFSDTWTQPATHLSVSSPSPVSDHGAAESETPTQSPAQAHFDSSAPSFVPEDDQIIDSLHELKGLASEETVDLLNAPVVGLAQASTLAGAVPAALSGSETSTPEDLRDYDSSSGVESRSDKQHTPIPTSIQPDVDQDLGIHMEKGDGEEEEAETLPADEVLGTGPPTAPASDPSTASNSGDEASDTEGEIQINDPDTPMTTDDRVEFESTSPTCALPALEEGEEDGGGATPQSANSVASYGFDCTTSNSNALSMAESCGKSPGIFSLENEEQLPEEAKDPSLIKELTLPSAAAAQAENRLGSNVDLMPMGHMGDHYPNLEEHHYLLGGKVLTDHLEDPLERRQQLEASDTGNPEDTQPPYYSTICDKTDSFVEADEKSTDEDEDHTWQSDSQEDNQNQNHQAFPTGNCHYLALVPGNRRPIDPALAEHFAAIAPPPPPFRSDGGAEQRDSCLRDDVEEEEQLRLEQQRKLELQRKELLLLQEQEEQRRRRHLLQWQLELEQQHRLQQKQMQARRSPPGGILSPSGLCTIYESMETSEEEEEEGEGGDVGSEEQNKNLWWPGRPSPQSVQRLPRPVPPQELEWNKRVDMVQQFISQTLILSADGSCPPLLLLPLGTGGTLSPLESRLWPNLPPQYSPPAATITSVSSFSPESRSDTPAGDWTVVELETQH